MIGPVVTLFNDPSKVKTGKFSPVPQATPAQAEPIRKTYGFFRWGDADKLFPDNIIRHGFYPLVEAWGDSDMVQVAEIKGKGHTTSGTDFDLVHAWVK